MLGFAWGFTHNNNFHVVLLIFSEHKPDPYAIKKKLKICRNLGLSHLNLRQHRSKKVKSCTEFFFGSSTLQVIYMFGFSLVGKSGGTREFSWSVSIENSSYCSHKYAGSVLRNFFKTGLKSGVYWNNVILQKVLHLD